MTKKNALIIAISEYDNLNDLDFCKNDGQGICKILESQNYFLNDDFKLIGKVDSHTLREKIIDFFADPRVDIDDTLFFYYSGHGIPDVDGDVYLSTSEMDPDFPFKKGYSFNDLTKMMRRSRSKKIVAILDCCFSGSATLTKGSDFDAAKLGNAAIVNSSDKLVEGEGICLLASSQAKQEAYALKDENHSVFTYYLMRGLEGNEEAIDKYGYVTADSLGKFVYNKIMSLPLEKRPKQRPVRKMELSGDIVLAYYPERARIKKKHMQQSESDDEDLGHEYVQRKEYGKALEYYDRIIKDTNQAKLWFKKGIVYNELGNSVEALKCFDITIELDSNNQDGWKYKGMSLFNLRRYDEALLSIDKCLALGPADENAWYVKGMSMHNLNKNEEALECLDKSISINPKAELAITSKGDILRFEGKQDEAHNLYDQAIKINPTLPLPWASKAILFYETGKYEEALKCFDTALEFIENYPRISNVDQIWNAKGNTLGSLDRHDEAISCFHEAIKLNPKDPMILINKGFSLVKCKKFAESIKTCESALAMDSIKRETKNLGTDLMNFIGCSLSVAYRFHEAKECFELTLLYDTTNENAKNFKDQLAVDPGKFRENLLKNIPMLKDQE